MPDLPTLEQKLKAVRQEVRTLQVIAMHPDQSEEKLELLRNLERLKREEVKQHLQAIERVNRRQRREKRTKQAALALFRMIFSHTEIPPNFEQ